MKVLVISGFLGAGKTSFIKALSNATKKNFVIVENEFGQLGVDAELIKSENDIEMQVWELTEGCICCSLNLDFSNSVLTIANTLNPEYLIVEPSGVAMTSNIVNQLNKICYEKIELLSPITIVDAQNYKLTKEKYSDYFYNQLNTAGTVILSKSEHFDEEEISCIEKDLNLEDETQFIRKHYSKWGKNEWEAILNKYLMIDIKNDKIFYHHERRMVSEEQILENISLENIKINSETDLIFILNILISGVTGDIARAKGYFNTGKNWVKFDLVDGQYSITGCKKMEDERAVVIGKNLNKNIISSIFGLRKRILV